SAAPASGSTAGGTQLTLTGTNFASGATVSVGGIATTAVTVVSATTITATTPAHAAGTVNVVVTNPDTRSATLANGFAHVAANPFSITGMAPTTGSTTGATVITPTH